MNTDIHDINKYLSKVITRLKNDKFHINQNILYYDQVFEYTARKTRFQIERFGFFTTYFLFARFTTPDIRLLCNFSTKSFRYAKKTSGIHPPRGLFYGIICFPVAITDSIDKNTADIIRKMEFPRHFAAFEKLVVFSLDNEVLHYSDKTPIWGTMYHDHDRQTICKLLTP